MSNHGYAHSDMLAELRMLETVRQMLDRDVLETYPLLTELLGVREEPSLVIDLVTSDLRQRLAQSGWRGQYVETPYVFTKGRVFILSSDEILIYLCHLFPIYCVYREDID